MRPTPARVAPAACPVRSRARVVQAVRTKTYVAQVTAAVTSA
ncbi:hypothetical protein ACFQ1B_12325 [Streptomyces mexicanus]